MTPRRSATAAIPVTISHEGWALEIPGSFAERRTPEEWWGGGVGRNITLAATETGTETGAMDARSFIEQFAGDLGPDAIDHRAGRVIGRATLSTDASSGLEVGVLEGYSAVVGSGAAIRIVFDDRVRLALGARHLAVARPGLIAAASHARSGVAQDSVRRVRVPWPARWPCSRPRRLRSQDR